MPNYIIGLAHFCEVHGPSTILCTQSTTAADEIASLLLPLTTKLHTCASCKLILPHSAVNLNTTIADRSGTFTTTYISAQYPSYQQRYTALTKLVMKALSTESTSDITKPIFFGDVVNGYCISRIFKISDVNARGGERKYSLMTVCDDEKSLLLGWETISLYLGELISMIQSQVEAVLLRKIEKGRPLGATHSAQGGSMFDNERYLRRSLTRPKSLIELTNDDQLFVKLHLWAIEVLRDITR